MKNADNPPLAIRDTLLHSAISNKQLTTAVRDHRFNKSNSVFGPVHKNSKILINEIRELELNCTFEFNKH